ncbi:thioredoxin domain-containing protein [Bathymodiolus thermophilus thioautotrophic gill symbiont]|uniref:thioredoxin domain-containing protein n=1 Tax=Bathymodiolus thermophilus thioautotrophic gill symbiont TaxID=2360 RepID=UPI00111736D8|nr:thioredoxin domain-containing protein [Bathymodiolus thermophilus thioautotrophic gill symbiont]
MTFLKALIFLFPTLLMAHSNQDLQVAYQQKNADYQPRTRHLENAKAKFTNHLILANSPYLLQHAHNPVNWYGFNDEAFKLAKQQNKLIFLSIGYATCHWCHVMEEESFEDLAVAKVLNKNFIAIKVDREVLPDVDSHFMGIAQLLTGSGGWPLNVVLTPAGDGFFAGTYFPKNTLITNLKHLQNIWQYKQNLITKTVASVKVALLEKTASATKLPQNLQSLAVQNLRQTFDEFDGGFGDAPKFPHEAQLLMLIDEQMRRPSDDKLSVITTTLDSMASGGIYDVVGGGFHRYATDNAWLFPHFEKMLYNQAQLALVYSKAYQLTRKPLYRRIAKQTLDYVIREMQNGGFYSATDADSDGEEGLFFIWDIQELKAVLGADFVEFQRYFELSSATEFERHFVIHFKNINNIQAPDFIKIDALLAKLYQVRQSREKPLLDNKILLSWNALLLKAFVVASKIDSKYLKVAQNLADFLLDNFYQQSLQRVQIEGQTSQQAIFEDYAYFVDGLIDLYDATGHQKYLITVQKLTDEAIHNFWDKKNFGFKISNNKRLNNNKEIYDGAIFNANGVAYGALNKLSARTQDKKYQQLAQQLLLSFSTKIHKKPSAYASIVKNYSNKQQGILANTVYAYDGRIKIQSNHNQIILNIQKGWHINANKVLQKSLIATQLISDNIKTINYPPAKHINLGFSQDKLAVYDEEITLNFSLKGKRFTLAELTLQACSDKVCLPPQQITLLLN